MGCMPSREFHESPQSLQYIRTESLVFIRIPLTPHFFPTPQSLAFQQLYNCRATQSSKYGFDAPAPRRKSSCNAEKTSTLSLSSIAVTENSEKTCCKRGDGKEMELHSKLNSDCRNRHDNDNRNNSKEEDDWDGVCEEELEKNPSAIYRESRDFLLPRCNESVGSTLHSMEDEIKLEKKNDKNNNITDIHNDYEEEEEDEHVRNYYCRSPEELYRVLITEGTVPAITDTNAEMRSLHEEELAWRSAREIIQNYRQRQRSENKKKEGKKWESEIPAAVLAAEKVLPPQRFLWPLPTAVLNVLTSNDIKYQIPPDDIIKNTIPCDGKLHLMEYNGTLFLAARSNTDISANSVSPIPVRVVGCDSLIPAVCRGTPWLRKLNATPNISNYNNSDNNNNNNNNNNSDCVDLEEDRYNEGLPHFQRPPVLCACLFCRVDVCCKAISRAQLAGYGHYALHSKMIGMSGLIVRPVWYLGIASNVPLLRLTAELRGLLQSVDVSTYSCMVASIRGNRILLRFQEKAVRVICEVCARSDNLAQQLQCQHMQQQQQKMIKKFIYYNYGGRIGVHSKTGELCVTTRIRKSLQMLENGTLKEKERKGEENEEREGERGLRGERVSKENGNNEKNGKKNVYTCKTELVFVVTIPWKTAKGPSSQRSNKRSVAATEGEERKKVIHSFSDGDLIVYNRTREEWELLSPSLVQLEHVLLYWVRETLNNNVFSHSDSGWLRRRQQSLQIVQEGRFHIWSFIHDGFPYFFGIMPKFAKERRKRELLLIRKEQMEEKRREQKSQQQDNTENSQDLRQEPLSKATIGLVKRYGDAANYFRNGCFMWNPYGRRR
ncbi:hypothetical protein LSM04_000404 [Trypanosoma melophagium]|uniref:uncharacterized protein n=1 Tax=Trypanosoma melophagium TaxID=715481 RepID=UPI00351AAF8D|nr:hypothetical protein LSM04_000404 [Trypanosoma melophagium]